MSTEDLEKYETEMELQLYREYRDIVRQFTYVVETERRFYLANSVDLQVREAGGEVYFELKLSDAWVWDMYRPARFVRNVRVLTDRKSTRLNSSHANISYAVFCLKKKKKKKKKQGYYTGGRSER